MTQLRTTSQGPSRLSEWIQRRPRAEAVIGLFLAWLVAVPSTHAVLPASEEVLPNFDRRSPATARNLAKAHQAETAARLQTPDLVIDWDPILTTPVWARASRGFLTAPRPGLPTLTGPGATLPADDPDRPLKEFLDTHRALFRHGSEVLTSARLLRDSTAPRSGLRTVVWEQSYSSVPIFEGRLMAHTTARGELVNVSARFHPDAARAAMARGADPAALLADPPLSASAALLRAARTVKQEMGAATVAALDPEPIGPSKRQRFQAAPLRGDVTAQLVWLPLSDTELRLCWEILLYRERGGLFRVLIDVQSGEAWLRQSLTRHASDTRFRVWTGDSPSPMSPGWPTLNTNQPPVVPRQLVGTNNHNFAAGPLGWIPDGANETAGNNVDAHLDVDGDNHADLPRPQGSPFRVFDFPVDLSQPPSSNSDAAVVQLFYWCNWMHDQLYDLGFTEAAGNFQLDNFGRGGLGADAVQADAQDGSDLNNADFSTPPDGSAPRMQMFLFTPASPDRDSCFDTEVVLHEYTHGLTDRLVGGGVGLFLSQSAGLGEGWSDFYALSLLSESSDDPHGAYPLGAYISHLLRGARDNYYFGIRRYPYSTDLGINPLTFKDIDPGQASAHPGVPRNVIGGGASEVHSQGEVWCATLWEARARLIDRLGHNDGNLMMLFLVTDALSLCPPNPTFVQARDAILQADSAMTGGANYRDLWAAFAKRGLGAGATAPSAATTGGVVESFDVPDNLLVRPSGAWVPNGPVGGPFVPSAQNYILTNLGSSPIPWQIVDPPPWLTLSSTSGELPVGGVATVHVALASAALELPAGYYTESLSFRNAASDITQPRALTLRIGQPDYFSEVFAANDFDLSFTTLAFVPDGSPGYYSVCRKATTQFPTDPAGGQFLSLTDDSFRMVALEPPATVALYGRRTNVFHVGSNGYLTLGGGDNSNARTLENHFAQPRVAALLEDLDPGVAGSVTWKALSNRVAVTYEQVPEYDQLNENSFQIELFFDGAIRLTWLHMDTRRGVVGLSAGQGVPLAFLESDLSTHGECVESVGPITMSATAAGVQLEWPTVSGASYRVEYKPHLNASTWTTLWTTNASAPVTTLLDPQSGNTQRFYRVVQP